LYEEARIVLSRVLKDNLAKAICKVLPKLAMDKKCYRIFEQAGFHITPNNFKFPIPDSTTLTDELWRKESGPVGLDMNTNMELKLLHEVFPQFREEFDFPETKDQSMQDYDFYFENDSFGTGDAEVLHSMIRHFKPKRIVEIGSGFSTYLSAKACLINKEKEGIDSKLVAIEPFPNDTLKKGFPGLSALIQKPLEEVDLDLFRDLEANDILFIDSTHILKIGGDVKYEYLEILPRLKNGVIVHSHDIFLPGEYPKSWVVDKHHFYTEQYLLQAFLAFNSAFEILWASQYMIRRYLDELIPVFPSYQRIALNNSEANHGVGSGSLWIRRKTKS